jgi:hypothetical protein
VSGAAPTKMSNRIISIWAAPYDGYEFPAMLDSIASCGARRNLSILIDNCQFFRRITALPMPRNLTLEPKYVGALNRWQLYISPTLSSTGKPRRLFYQTKRRAETAAELFERRQKKISGAIFLANPTRAQILYENEIELGLATARAIAVMPYLRWTTCGKWNAVA